jgi:hypothetical protein
MCACWAEAGLYHNEQAHVKCLEERLGRPLVYKDFNTAAINDVWTCRLALPCPYCLFEEMKKRYANMSDISGTLAKLAILNPGGSMSPKKKIVTDRCTCDELP